MEAQLDILRTFPQNKGDIQALACDWTNQILDGNSDPIKVAIQIKKVQAVLDQVTAGIKDYVLIEAEKYGKTTEIEGVKIEISELGVRYDYSVCGDSVWSSLDNELKLLTEKKKEREKFLVAIPDTGTVDPETGELINKPLRSGTRGIKMTIK
jgi:hypothetical protein